MSHKHKAHVIAGETAVLARRYATALFELATERNLLKEVAVDLEAMQQVIDGDKKFHVMAAHPRIPAEAIKKVVKAIAEGAKLQSLTAAFLNQLAHNHRLAILDHIIESFQTDLAKKNGLHVADITATHALSGEQQETLSAHLGKMVGGTVRLQVVEDPDLLGGMTIKIGSRLIDASVQGKLVQVERQLKSQTEAA